MSVDDLLNCFHRFFLSYYGSSVRGSLPKNWRTLSISPTSRRPWDGLRDGGVSGAAERKTASRRSVFSTHGLFSYYDGSPRGARKVVRCSRRLSFFGSRDGSPARLSQLAQPDWNLPGLRTLSSQRDGRT